MSLRDKNNYSEHNFRCEDDSLSAADRLIARAETVLAMPGWERSRLFRFGVAIAGVLVAAAVRAALEPVLGERGPIFPSRS